MMAEKMAMCLWGLTENMLESRSILGVQKEKLVSQYINYVLLSFKVNGSYCLGKEIIKDDGGKIVARLSKEEVSSI